MAANDPTTRVDIVDEATWNKVLEAAENPLPVPKEADKGKYLKSNETTGKPEWAEGGGSGGGVLVVHDVSGTLDKTWQEIYDAGFCVVATGTEDDITYMPLFNAYEYDGDYGVGAMTIDANNNAIIIWYMASSADGYPVHEPSA